MRCNALITQQIEHQITLKITRYAVHFITRKIKYIKVIVIRLFTQVHRIEDPKKLFSQFLVMEILLIQQNIFPLNKH